MTTFQANINTIAEQSGIGKGTIYLYFENKRELFLDMLRHIAQAQLGDIRAALATDGSLHTTTPRAFVPRLRTSRRRGERRLQCLYEHPLANTSSCVLLACGIDTSAILLVMLFFSIKGSKEMLRLSVSYKALLQIAGLVLLLYGLFWVVSALFVQTDVSGDLHYIGPLLFWDAGQILAYIFYGLPLLANPVLGVWFHGFALAGPLLYVSIGLCLLTLSTLRPRLAYWSLQLALWLVSMSFWSSLARAFNQNGIEIPGSFTPFFWITLVCSLVLLAAYIPVVAVLKKLCMLLTIGLPEMDVLGGVRTKE